MFLYQQLKVVCVWTLGFLVMILHRLVFSVLQFEPPEPEVLAEIKTDFLQCFLPSHSLIRAFAQCHTVISFSMTWRSWLPHCIMF